MTNKPARTFFTILMDLFVVLAIAQTARLVVRFFGQLASQGWATTLVTITDAITVPLGFDAIRTPYGGVFDVDGALTVVFLLIVEWALSVVRARVSSAGKA